MNVPQETLNELAETALRINGYFLQIADYLRRADAPDHVKNLVETARRLNVKTQHSLVRAGADDPLEAAQADTRARLSEAGHAVSEPKPIPLELLSSSAARRYAAAIREAATACREMETERYGPHCDGFAEMLEDWAADAELEAYGPPGLRGIE